MRAQHLFGQARAYLPHGFRGSPCACSIYRASVQTSTGQCSAPGMLHSLTHGSCPCTQAALFAHHVWEAAACWLRCAVLSSAVLYWYSIYAPEAAQAGQTCMLLKLWNWVQEQQGPEIPEWEPRWGWHDFDPLVSRFDGSSWQILSQGS